MCVFAVRLLRIRGVFAACSRRGYCEFAVRLLRVRRAFIACSQCGDCASAVCLQCVHRVGTASLLRVSRMFSVFTARSQCAIAVLPVCPLRVRGAPTVCRLRVHRVVTACLLCVVRTANVSLLCVNRAPTVRSPHAQCRDCAFTVRCVSASWPCSASRPRRDMFSVVTCAASLLLLLRVCREFTACLLCVCSVAAMCSMPAYCEFTACTQHGGCVCAVRVTWKAVFVYCVYCDSMLTVCVTWKAVPATACLLCVAKRLPPPSAALGIWTDPS